MRFLTSVFVAAILAATQASAEPEAVELSDLADPFAVAFEDPYAAMGVDMLNELKLLVQSDEKLAGTDLDEETRTRLEARRTAAQDKLEANGHDVDVPLRVSGLLRAEPSDTTVFLHDGESRMLSGWTLDAETIHFPES
mgnify:CR=1 FL=1